MTSPFLGPADLQKMNVDTEDEMMTHAWDYAFAPGRRCLKCGLTDNDPGVWAQGQATPCSGKTSGGGIECVPLDDLYGITAARNEERARCIGIVTALWGADLATTQAALSGEVTLDEAIRRWREAS